MLKRLCSVWRSTGGVTSVSTDQRLTLMRPGRVSTFEIRALVVGNDDWGWLRLRWQIGH